MMKSESILVECLVSTYNFELLWAYYLQSDGRLFPDECQNAANELAKWVTKTFKEHPEFAEKVEKDLRSWSLEETFKALRDWKTSQQKFPFPSAWESRFRLFIALGKLKSLCIQKLNLESHPTILFSSEEFDFRSSAIRWADHLPVNSLTVDLDQLVKEASAKETIAVSGDIRKSQDLMTYAESPEDFSTHMVEFITKIRELSNKHHGFFDKFTGDGFIIYFNELISSQGGGFVNNFLAFIDELQAFCINHFQDWTANIRKTPPQLIGLAIGADLGFINFLDVENHLVAVGDSIVWATRMSAAANANEVIVNNRLFQKLLAKNNLSFSDIASSTKSGEGFLAHKLTFNK